MADLDYYALYADVKDILMNQNLGVADGNIIDEAAIEKMLKSMQGKIHLRLRRTTLVSITNEVHVEVLKDMQISLITQLAIRARHMKENNLADTDVLTTYWTLSPNFSKEQKADLATIRDDLEDNSYNFNTRSGAEVH